MSYAHTLSGFDNEYVNEVLSEYYAWVDGQYREYMQGGYETEYHNPDTESNEDSNNVPICSYY